MPRNFPQECSDPAHAFFVSLAFSWRYFAFALLSFFEETCQLLAQPSNELTR